MTSRNTRRDFLSAAATTVGGLSVAPLTAASSPPVIDVGIYRDANTELGDLDEAVTALETLEEQISADLAIHAEPVELETDFNYNNRRGTLLDVQEELIDDGKLGDRDIHVVLYYTGLTGVDEEMGGAGFNVWQWGTDDPNAGIDTIGIDEHFGRHIEVDRNYAFAFVNAGIRALYREPIYKNTVIHEVGHTFNLNHGVDETRVVDGNEVDYDEPGAILEDAFPRATPMATWYADKIAGSNDAEGRVFCGTPGEDIDDGPILHTTTLSPCSKVEFEAWIDEHTESFAEPVSGSDDSIDEPTGSDGSDDDSGNDGNDDVSVDMEVDDWSVSTDQASVGETVEWEVTVTNWTVVTEDTIRMSVGDRVFFEEPAILDPGETADAEGELTLQPEDAGAQEVTVELVESGNSATADLRVTNACTGADSVGYHVKELSASDEFRVGEPTSVDVAFLHCGDSDDLLPSVELTFGEQQVWSDSVWEPTDGTELGDTVDVVPQPGAWESDVALRASSDVDEEVRTVEVAPAPFEVAFDAEPTASDGTLTVEAAVTNQGAGTDRQPVELEVDGEVRAEETVELAAGQTQVLTFEADVSVGNAAVSVGSETDEARAAVRVGPELSVSIEPARDPVTHAAEVVSVEATVENASDEAATVDLVGDGGAETATTPVTVAGGGSETATLAVPIQPDPASDLTVAVRADLDGVPLATDTATLGVVGELDVEVEGQTPAPHGEDGLYRDLNGDGSVTNSDVTLFFRNQHVEPIDGKPAYFDFNGNGKVGQGDVKQLFNEL